MTSHTLTLLRFTHTAIPEKQMLMFSAPCVVVQNLRQDPRPVVLGGTCALTLPTNPTLPALRSLLQSIGVPRQKLAMARYHALFGATGYARTQDSHLYLGHWPTASLKPIGQDFSWTPDLLDKSQRGGVALQLVSKFVDNLGQPYPEQLTRLDKATALLSDYLDRPITVLEAGEASNSIASPTPKQSRSRVHPLTPKR